MVLSRCLGPLAVLATGAAGARISRRKGAQPEAQFIAGVPVLNYEAAYEGEGALVEGQIEAEWVVMAQPGTTNAQLAALCRTTPHGCRLQGHPSEGGVPFVELRGTEGDLEAMLQTMPGVVKYIEPDQAVQMTPELEASPEASTWGLQKIGAERRGRSGASTTVFVLDTGVRVSHSDFRGRAAPALDMSIGDDPTECESGDLSCAADRQGHGTHCAGTAAGTQYGVAPGAAVRAVKVLTDRGGGSWSWSYYALDWLASRRTGPAVASMSLGGPGNYQAMKDAVDGAVSSGVVVVVAGGNDNMDACRHSPAFVPSAITVGSTASGDARSWFSNYGACTNIWAPGSDVLSAGHRSDEATATMSGTSMACPHVSGAALLVLAADPTKKPAAVLQELLDVAAVNYLAGLEATDTNALLYIGTDGPPPPNATPPPGGPVPPPRATPPPGTDPRCASKNAVGPDFTGDCTCLNNHRCYQNGSSQSGCPWFDSKSTSGKFAKADCDDCMCVFEY